MNETTPTSAESTTEAATGDPTGAELGWAEAMGHASPNLISVRMAVGAV